MKYFLRLIPLQLLLIIMDKREESLACILLSKYKTNNKKILSNLFSYDKKVHKTTSIIL